MIYNYLHIYFWISFLYIRKLVLGKETNIEAIPQFCLIDVIKIWINCGEIYSSEIHGDNSIKTSIKLSHY